MADLLMVPVLADGTPGNTIGVLRLVDDAIEADEGPAADTVDMLRRRTKLDDPALWKFLITRGWSNGALMLVKANVD